MSREAVAVCGATLVAIGLTAWPIEATLIVAGLVLILAAGLALRGQRER